MTMIADTTVADQVTACSLLSWCDGHAPFYPESEGVHIAKLPLGEYVDGTPRFAHVIRFEPMPKYPAGRWEVNMPDGEDEWSFAPADAEAEFERACRQLDLDRAAVRAFIAEHVAAEPGARS